MVFDPCQSLIVYPNDSLASETNLTKIQPLMKHIQTLKDELLIPRSYRQDCYKFSNLVSYFQGAGSKIVSKSCKIAIGDEVDAWPIIGKLDNVADLKKRTRSYSSSINFLVCTPSEENGKIWKSFLKSSQGYWHLRCQHCGELTIRSCDIHNLQFETTFNEELREHIVVPESMRLVCPSCGFEHTEDMKHDMNVQGGYIHKLPQKKKEAPGYQIGALASQLQSLSWANIATAQLEAGRNSDIETQTTFDNSWRGLPYKRREITKDDLDGLKKHCWKPSESPSLDNVEIVFLVADTQDDRSVVGIFALDVNDNLFMIESKEVQHLILSDDERNKINLSLEDEAKKNLKEFTPIETVEDLLNKKYLVRDGVGITPMFGVIDRQGHRSNDIQYFSSKHSNVIMYQGTQMTVENFRQSDNIKKLFLVSAKHYQSSLIYYLYSQKKRGQNFLFFSPNVEDNVLTQIKSVAPDSSKKFGDAPENWMPLNGAVHDWFDVVKMAYFAVDWAFSALGKQRYRFCKSPALQRRWERVLQKQKDQQQLETAETESLISNSESWFK